MSWAIKKVEGGHVVTWAGQEYGMAPATLEWCQGYVERLKVRYPGGAAWLVAMAAPRTRGGPWRWTAPDGQSEVIHVGRLSDAKGVLRHRLRRKALPKGLKWSLEERA
jgi:hypothetical protein